MPVYNSFMVMHKVQQDKGIQVCEIGKPEANAIMNVKAISIIRGIRILLKRSMTTEIKGLPVYKGTNHYKKIHFCDDTCLSK